MKFLEDSNVFQNPIVTTLEPLDVFYNAEEEHHDYYDLNTEQSYCQYVILPKIKTLNERFSDKLKTTK